MFPGHDPAQVLALLRQIAAPDNVAVEPVDEARPADASPLREDVMGAFTAEIHARYPGVAIVPNMSTGATDGLYFRNRGVPVYGVEFLGHLADRRARPWPRRAQPAAQLLPEYRSLDGDDPTARGARHASEA